VYLVDSHTSSSEKVSVRSRVGVTRSEVAIDCSCSCWGDGVDEWQTGGNVFGCCCRWSLLSLFFSVAATAAAASNPESGGELSTQGTGLGLPGQPGLVMIASENEEW
jgi:hypothetical protein